MKHGAGSSHAELTARGLNIVSGANLPPVGRYCSLQRNLAETATLSDDKRIHNVCTCLGSIRDGY